MLAFVLRLSSFVHYRAGSNFSCSVIPQCGMLIFQLYYTAYVDLFHPPIDGAAG